MISPELLRRYPFFGPFDDAELKALAMIAEERTIPAGETLVEEGKPAISLYLLMVGSIDLYFPVQGENQPGIYKELPVGEINPGEPFGISAIIEPYISSASTRASKNSQVIVIDALALRKLCNDDQILACKLLRQVAKAAMERLKAVRVQLAAARA